MTPKQPVVTLLVLCGACFLGAFARMDPEKGELIQNIFRQFLKIRPGSGRNSMHDGPPRHMLELYHKFTEGGASKRTFGNTVRNIYPAKSVSGTDDPYTLVFNLTGIEKSEEIKRAQLHLHRRRLPRSNHFYSTRQLAPPFRIRFYHKSPLNSAILTSLPVPYAVRGWHSYDVSNIIRECRDEPGSVHMLGVRFESPRWKNHDSRWIPVDKFLREGTSAFLVVFSDDQENITLDETLENLIPFSDSFEEDYGDDDVFSDTAFRRKHSGRFGQRGGPRRSRPRSNEFEDPVTDAGVAVPGNVPERQYQWTQPGSSGGEQEISNDLIEEPPPRELEQDKDLSRFPETSNTMPVLPTSRQKRSIIDNELPDDSLLAVNATRTHPEILKTRERLSYIAKEHRKPKKVTNVIPYPEETKRWKGGKKRGRKGKRRGGKKKGRGVNNAVEDNSQDREGNDTSLKMASPSVTSATCQKRKLYINFADIGWSDHIVAPNAFDANYCSGTCSREGVDNVVQYSTNHALILSLLHAFGKHPEVPEPCCVPESLDPISVLYFEEDGNVILKTFAKMSVTQCACR